MLASGCGENTVGLLCDQAVGYIPCEKYMFDRITFNPQIIGGRACIRGMRITVSLVVSLVANGMSIEEILREYPDLEAEDISASLQYAAFLTSEEIHPFIGSQA